MIIEDKLQYVVPDEEYYSFLKKSIAPQKVFKISEIKKVLLGEVDPEAYFYIAEKYNISYDLAKIYIDNSLLLKSNIDEENIPNSIKILLDIKKDIFEKYYIFFSPRKKVFYKGLILEGLEEDFLDLIPLLKDKKIPYKTEFRKTINKRQEVFIYDNKIKEVVDTINYLAEKINEGADLSSIEIVAPLSYINLVQEVLELFKIPYEDEKHFLNESKLAEIYLSYLRKGEEVPSEIKEINNDLLPSIIEQKTLLNSLLDEMDNLSCKKELKLEYFISKLEKTKLSTLIDGVKISNSLSFSEDKYIFILGFDEKIIPSVKEVDYLSDILKEKYSYELKSYEKNHLFEVHLKDRINIASYVHLSLIPDEDGNERNAFSDDDNFVNVNKFELKKERYSKQADKFLYADYELKKRLYNNDSDLYRYLKKLSFENIGTYDNTFKKPEGKTFKLNKVAYSSISKYFGCPFSYYCNSVLKIGKSLEDNENTIFGNAVHKSLEDYINEKAENISRPTLENEDKLSASEIFYANLKIDRFMKLAPEIEGFLSKLKFFTLETEKKDYAKLSNGVTLEAKYDLFAQNEDRYLIFDYKTGNNSFQYPFVSKGYDLQLPLYLLAANKLNPDKSPIGAYLVLVGNEKLVLDGVAKGKNGIAFAIDEYVKNIRNRKAYSSFLDDDSYFEMLNSLENLLVQNIKEIEDFNFPIRPYMVTINNAKDTGKNPCSFCEFNDCCLVRRRQRVYENIEIEGE